MKVRNWAISALRHAIALIAAFSSSRGILNWFYLKLSWPQLNTFREIFRHIFKDTRLQASAGIWKVRFANKVVLMPLSPESMHPDWPFALNLTGLETDIKRTYEALILSPITKPDIFVDVGTNFGTHSLLFLVNGVETISIEPNLECRTYFERICKLNNVVPTLERVALGDHAAIVDLLYPQGETWLGSVDIQTQQNLSQSKEIISVKIEQKTLDDYYPKLRNKRVLIKIDTEGNELAVLYGAKRVLRECKPSVIFESWQSKDQRSEIFRFLESENYIVHALPQTSDVNSITLSFESFLNQPQTNFIALPKLATKLHESVSID